MASETASNPASATSSREISAPSLSPAVVPAPGSVGAVAAASAAIGPNVVRSIGVSLSAGGLLTAAIIAVAFTALFHHWLYVQNFLSWNVADWTHAYFVPAISLYLLWQRRAELAAAPTAVFWPGLLPMLLGVVSYLFFQIGAVNNHMAQGWALVLTLFGTILLLGGPRLIRVLFFPICYTVFAVAVSDPIMRGITFRLQLIASEGAYILLNLVGISCDLDGNVLKVTTSRGIEELNVAEACAGMRMVIGFVALGAAVALSASGLWWKRVALFVLGIPIAVLMNVVRVAFLGVLTTFNPELAKGQSHMFMGTIVMVLAFFLYMALVWALNTAVREDTADPAKNELSASSVTIDSFWRRDGAPFSRLIARPAVLAALALLAVAAIGVPTAVVAMGIHLKKQPINAPGGRVVAAIPTETASWTRIGTDTQETEEMVEELGTQNYLTRFYIRRGAVQPSSPAAKSTRPAALNLHLAYYTGMIDTIPHIPERCLVGGGWEITGATQVVPLPLVQSSWRASTNPGDNPGELLYALTDTSYSDLHDAKPIRLPKMPGGIGLRITEFVQPKTKARLFAGYFFIANGTVTDSADNVRLLAFDLRDDYAYYLKVQFSSDSAQSAEELAQQAGSLLSDLFPEIMRSVPDWNEVEAGRYPPDNPRAKAKLTSSK